MTQNVRTGLGLLAVALMALLVGLAIEGYAATIARVVAGFCALVGLGSIAWDLLRPQTKSSSGVRSSDDT
jgi:hypothetical protein